MDSKKLIARVLCGLSFVGVVAAPGCAPEDETVDADEAELSAPGGALGPALFRNDFFTYLKRDGRYSDEQIRQLVLMPTEEAISPKFAFNPAAPMQSYDDAFKSITPKDFYQQGLVTPLLRRVGPNGPLENELRRNPVHIVIVPGIFGEFISNSPFEETFRYGGAASVVWDRKMKELESDPKTVEQTKDKQFSAAALGDIQRSLREMMRVASIDDTDGTPLVTITYLKPEAGSLETFGTLDENVDYYLPRLEKYFKIVGVPEHLYVMGYSRGTATALNLISRAEQTRASWMRNLKGMIGLAGVVYGSQLADAAMSPGPQKDLLDTTIDFVENKLESCTEEEPGAWLITKNLGHWTAYLGRAALIARNMTNQNEALAREGIETSMADAGRFVSFAQRILFGNPDQVFTEEYSTGAITGVLNLSAPNAEYCQNIERFKKTATQIVKGVNSLATQSRMDWWKTHTVPSNIRYYSITGTMGDATPKGKPVSPLAVNTTAYDTRSLDFRSLRGNYYDLLAASGTQLQDSQVPVQRGRFWPELHPMLNPAQKPIKHHFMGTVGIHHWGLSFPRAFATKDGLEANPFPRTIFLKSIGTFVAQVERRTR
jgi:hypothetical protein